MTKAERLKQVEGEIAKVKEHMETNANARQRADANLQQLGAQLQQLFGAKAMLEEIIRDEKKPEKQGD